MKKVFLLFALCLAVFSACEDVKLDNIVEPAQTVSNLNAVVEDGNAIINWTLPASSEMMSVQLFSEAIGLNYTIANNPKGDTLINIVVNTDMLITAKVKYADGRVSEGVTIPLRIDGTNPVANVTAERVNNDINVTWELPQSNSGSEIVIKWGELSTETVTLNGSETSYTISGVLLSKKYEIGVRTQSATQYSNYVFSTVNSVNIAYYLVAGSVDLADDDEKASHDWFVSKYPDMDVITPSQLENNEIDLSKYSAIWIDLNRIGLLPGVNNLPEELMSENVLTKFTAYYTNGGNLLLSVHANQYLVALGRTTRLPGIYGAGNGGTGTDVWALNCKIGNVEGQIYDHYQHPAFASITPRSDVGFGQPVIPLLGPGSREDHNTMWDCNSFGYTPEAGSNVIRSFEIENNAVVLGTWGQVVDYCCAGMVEFLPNPNGIRGRAICIGVGAYEFDQNSNENIYQSYIEEMTDNCLTYLRK